MQSLFLINRLLPICCEISILFQISPRLYVLLQKWKFIYHVVFKLLDLGRTLSSYITILRYLFVLNSKTVNFIMRADTLMNLSCVQLAGLVFNQTCEGSGSLG